MVNPKIELPRTVAAVTTVNSAAPAGQHLPVDATAGPLTVTLPAAIAGNAGAHLSIEKTDSSSNAVTITGPLRGTTGTLTLTTSHETIEFRADGAGSWWPQANHLPKAYVAAAIAAQAAADAATYSPLLPLLATVTTAVAPTVSKIQPYNATAGVLASALPALSGLAVGATLGVQKAEVDTSVNVVTLTVAGSDTFDSAATSLNLRVKGELRILQVVSVSGTKYWKVVGGNTPLSTTDLRYGRPTTTTSFGGLSAPTGTGLEFVISSSGLDDIRFNGVSL